MARLQILPLPEGAGDDRPPFVLVIDEAATGPDGELLIKAADYIEAREHIGACDVFIFEETVEIPANEPPPLPKVDDAERAGITQVVYAHERTRLDLCGALLVSGDTTWRKLIEQATERQRELAHFYRARDRVRDLPERPKTVAVNPEEPYAYMDGYAAGIRAAKQAVEHERPQASEHGR